MELQLNNVSIEVLLKYCRILRPVWTLTWKHCKSPTMFSTPSPTADEDIYYNNDIGSQCLKEIGDSHLKTAYDYIKTDNSTMKNVVYYISEFGNKHRVYSTESQSIGYLLSIIRHQRRLHGCT